MPGLPEAPGARADRRQLRAVRLDRPGATVRKGAVMGPFGVEPPELPTAAWWWQVLGADSRDPVIGQGRAEREIMAVALTETQIRACEGTIGGMIMGPGGVVKRALKTRDDGIRWVAAGG